MQPVPGHCNIGQITVATKPTVTFCLHMSLPHLVKCIFRFALVFYRIKMNYRILGWLISFMCLIRKRQCFTQIRNCINPIVFESSPVEVGKQERGYALLVRWVRGICPEKMFDLWLPLCTFLMHFGCVFCHNSSRLWLILNRQHLFIH